MSLTEVKVHLEARGLKVTRSPEIEGASGAIHVPALLAEDESGAWTVLFESRGVVGAADVMDAHSDARDCEARLIVASRAGYSDHARRWAERFDVELLDFAAVARTVAERARATEIALAEAEAAAMETPPQPEGVEAVEVEVEAAPTPEPEPSLPAAPEPAMADVTTLLDDAILAARAVALEAREAAPDAPAEPPAAEPVVDVAPEPTITLEELAVRVVGSVNGVVARARAERADILARVADSFGDLESRLAPRVTLADLEARVAAADDGRRRAAVAARPDLFAGVAAAFGDWDKRVAVLPPLDAVLAGVDAAFAALPVAVPPPVVPIDGVLASVHVDFVGIPVPPEPARVRVDRVLADVGSDFAAFPVATPPEPVPVDALLVGVDVEFAEFPAAEPVALAADLEPVPVEFPEVEAPAPAPQGVDDWVAAVEEYDAAEPDTPSPLPWPMPAPMAAPEPEDEEAEAEAAPSPLPWPLPAKARALEAEVAARLATGAFHVPASIARLDALRSALHARGANSFGEHAEQTAAGGSAWLARLSRMQDAATAEAR